MVRIMMQLYFAMRFLQTVIPYVRKAILGALQFLLTPIIAIWIGVPQATDGIANYWVEKANQAGVVIFWHRRLYYLIRVVAFFTILLGWIVIAYITVWIVEFIF